RPRGADPDGPPAVLETPVPGGDRGVPEGPGHRPRGPASALQPDVVLARAGGRGPRPARAAALRALQGRRVGAGDHRPLPPAPSRGQQRAAGDPRTYLDRPRWPEAGDVRGGDAGASGSRPLRLVLAAAVPAQLPHPPPPPAPAAASVGITFVDVTGKAGIHFKHTSGAFGKKYLPETLGAGAAFFDFDGDGWQDIFLVNSKNWPGHPGQRTLPA